MSQVVVVTGASAGLGRAIAHAFAKEGARIGLIARSKKALELTAIEVEKYGGRAMVLPADVSRFEEVEAAAAKAEAELGPIDVWVNDAMVSVFSPVAEMTPDDFRRVTEVTYLGYVHGTMAALKRMRSRNKGVIVQVGSALAYRGIPLQSAYCAAKHAIQGFCDSLRCELIHDHSAVEVTMVQMPALNTPQFRWVKSRLARKAQPVPPIFQPEVGAEAVVYAAHYPRREFWVGMPAVKAIFANKWIPGLLDHYLANFGYDSQQYDGEEDPARAHNLFEPVEGKHSTHGDFDTRAESQSLQLWSDFHRSWLIGGVLALGALLGVAAVRRAVT